MLMLAHMSFFCHISLPTLSFFTSIFFNKCNYDLSSVILFAFYILEILHNLNMEHFVLVQMFANLQLNFSECWCNNVICGMFLTCFQLSAYHHTWQHFFFFPSSLPYFTLISHCPAVIFLLEKSCNSNEATA